ncbi:tol-pal system protein YbgF [Agitococcus lubricus]|uniref:Cell division coordinator CpoB n=1 Tax=Agitococcus lubricus TaxID=1077255 RepID=A0A2T5IWG3_9GAMM|nr:tol-pal system protein YbgF [Agitococcus lubricus]PTQ88263.1 tol-pal system protein YbgF [Agitococcus lubricus]
MSRFFVLATTLSALSIAQAADIIVEEKPLSAAPVQTQSIPATKPIQAQPLDSTPSMQWQLYQQVQQLQQEVRDLRGQLEVQANVIERMKQDARNRYLDLDQRITELKNRPVNADGSTLITATQPSTTIMANTAAITNATPITTTPPTADSTTPNPDDEKKAYFAAYQTFKTGGPNKAITPMRNFIKNYPQSTYIASAYYWLGEFYLAASPADVANAKKSFKIVSEQYPDAPKAASALLKLGSFADVDGKTQEAIKYMLKIVKDFPNSEEAKAAKSYLAAQNVPIPVDKAKAKIVDNTKTADKTKPSVKEDKTKNTEKPKTTP